MLNRTDFGRTGPNVRSKLYYKQRYVLSFRALQSYQEVLNGFTASVILCIEALVVNNKHCIVNECLERRNIAAWR